MRMLNHKIRILTLRSLAARGVSKGEARHNGARYIRSRLLEAS